MQRQAIVTNSAATDVHTIPSSSVPSGMPTAVVDVPQIQGALTSFAAASLGDAFKDIGANIEQINPGTRLRSKFAGSPTPRRQLSQGVRADVFASADEPTMQDAQQDGSIAGTPFIFAHNRLIVMVPAQNPAAIATLHDLAKPRIKLVLAHQDVPVGSYSRHVLTKMRQDPAYEDDFAARVMANLVSEEVSVKQVVTKVQLGSRCRHRVCDGCHPGRSWGAAGDRHPQLAQCHRALSHRRRQGGTPCGSCAGLHRVSALAGWTDYPGAAWVSRGGLKAIVALFNGEGR